MKQTYAVGLGKEIELALGSIANYPADVIVGCPFTESLEEVVLRLTGQTLEELSDKYDELSDELKNTLFYLALCCRAGSDTEETKEIFYSDNEAGLQSALETAKKAGKNWVRVEHFTIGTSSVQALGSSRKVVTIIPRYLVYDTRNGGWTCDSEVITSVVAETLVYADKNYRASTLAFPSLTEGVYQISLEEAIPAMGNGFVKHLLGDTSIQKISLVVKTPEEYQRVKPLLERVIATSAAYD